MVAVLSSVVDVVSTVGFVIMAVGSARALLLDLFSGSLWFFVGGISGVCASLVGLFVLAVKSALIRTNITEGFYEESL